MLRDDYRSRPARRRLVQGIAASLVVVTVPTIWIGCAGDPYKVKECQVLMEHVRGCKLRSGESAEKMVESNLHSYEVQKLSAGDLAKACNALTEKTYAKKNLDCPN